ncbi:calcium/sodium:proton antiporter [Arsukibacterium ikkense]|uniref:Calcium/sodium:proton antiporter n=1 Tax=Arsukibacterium ikkense TaxID=336831 RepID=A0A0M2V610_9GAMM|nr:calcium/sodium antiporter [Arsukibacterium ikkense]KKO46272.1 calcium/sodium:proton antiporter [Arsukibacterium ikkense]
MSPLLVAIFFVVVGLVLLIWSADRFVFGASSIARNSGISPMVIGLTIVAMGSSAPEMLVSATAAWQGKLDTSVGNAIGSNITNILLVIGVAALLKPIAVSSLTLRREFPLLLICTLFGYYLLSDDLLTRTEGILLLLAFVSFLVLLVYWGKHASPDDPLIAEIDTEMPVVKISTVKAIVWVVIGLLLLLASSQLLVQGAVTIARYAGISDLVIGLTIIAIGTSLPELAASIIGILKGEDDLALGNIIGSNIFNILAVLGLGAVIGPGVIDANAGSRDSYVMIAATVAMLLMSVRFTRMQRINRVEGAILLASFVGYQYLLFSYIA